ncbi:polyamine aminopropyltransferase [Croceimicrobium hydrocarbonivorans]|uniref:Polyamine aminopropyltransferase n=1 Tax=Croceimicrobium hydrocarbonivorans TaxID=2761580 RepID=A0A7H0VJW3_9FLAO|nr:polyamine aminopropyltransferase [Croceimicrobium hydrocarbonivorans]
MKNRRSPFLKLALFATGLSGIVAEYILSTLATYFIGDSAVQWSLIVSVMLFSMGLGSRISKYLEGNLLIKFIGVEFALSLLVSFSSLIAYSAAGFTDYVGLIIYGMSILIGLLIGLEIPLVIRLNEEFESLKVNIASVMEKDYLGSLVGGLFFAFVGLPILGLTYTPFILGFINLLVAVGLFITVRRELGSKFNARITISSGIIILVMFGGITQAQDIIFFGEQKRYKDKVVFSAQSKYQKIVMTQWKDHYWLYLNGNQQLSTLDEDKYHEALVHPAMKLSHEVQDVLILGGGDGCAAREVLKYPSVKSITVVDLDSMMTGLATRHPILKELNEASFSNPKVKVLNADAFTWLENSNAFFDVIMIDLPDPRSVELNRMYTEEFYRICNLKLRPHGVLITQAGSPYFATKAFKCIDKSMMAAGFETLPLHNHVITLGEWGWVLGQKQDWTQGELKQRARGLRFEDIDTRWLNNEAMLMMSAFGKEIYFEVKDSIEINHIQDPVLYRYYLKGNWDLY